MSIPTRIAERWAPTFLKKRELKRLFEIVGSAFGTMVPPTKDLSYRDSLALFAEFSAMEAGKVLERDVDVEFIRSQLYKGAFELGESFRRKWRVSGMSEVMDVGRMLYKFLGIEFIGTPEGSIAITRCLFANYYSADTCRLISSLDEGMMAGLSGGGMLTFSGRITEGFHSCTANVLSKENGVEKSHRSGHRCWWCNCC